MADLTSMYNAYHSERIRKRIGRNASERLRDMREEARCELYCKNDQSSDKFYNKRK